MNICSVESALLSTSCGKYVCIEGRRRRRPSQSHELVMENRMESDLGNSAKVKVYHILYGTRKCMAFCFEVNKKSVFPVVTHGTEVSFKDFPTDKPITVGNFDQTFLFQWDEKDIHGDWRSLKSVAEPNKYLIDEENGKEKRKVIITNERSPIFKICYSDMKRDNGLQSFCRSDKFQENTTTSCKKTPWQRRDSKQGPSCFKRAAPTKPLCCPERKTKRMKSQ